MRSEDILVVAEVARLLRVSERTVQRLVAAEGIPFFRVGRSIRFLRSSVEVWLRAAEEQPQSEEVLAGPQAKRGRQGPSEEKHGRRWFEKLKMERLTEGAHVPYPDQTASLRPDERR